MPKFLIALALAVAAMPGFADTVTKPASGSVAETMDALEAAVTGAGATVFARVDHAAGAQTVGKSLADAQLLIFGNPALGTLAMEDDLRAGLMLPLRVLVYDSGAGTVIHYATAEELFDDLEIDEDAEVVGRINAALGMLTDKAAGG